MIKKSSNCFTDFWIYYFVSSGKVVALYSRFDVIVSTTYVPLFYHVLFLLIPLLIYGCHHRGDHVSLFISCAALW